MLQVIRRGVGFGGSKKYRNPVSTTDVGHVNGGSVDDGSEPAYVEDSRFLTLREVHDLSSIVSKSSSTAYSHSGMGGCMS